MAMLFALIPMMAQKQCISETNSLLTTHLLLLLCGMETLEVEQQILSTTQRNKVARFVLLTLITIKMISFEISYCNTLLVVCLLRQVLCHLD